MICDRVQGKVDKIWFVIFLCVCGWQIAECTRALHYIQDSLGAEQKSLWTRVVLSTSSVRGLQGALYKSILNSRAMAVENSWEKMCFFIAGLFVADRERGHCSGVTLMRARDKRIAEELTDGAFVRKRWGTEDASLMRENETETRGSES